MNEHRILEAALKTVDSAARSQDVNETCAENPTLQDANADKLIDLVNTSLRISESQTIVDKAGDTATSMLLAPPCLDSVDDG